MIEVVGATKVYQRGRLEVRALAGISLQVPRGEFVSIMGPSGSGKSTLPNLRGALDTPSSGVVRIEGRELSRMGDEELSAFRRERLGFVFQFFNLMPTLTALENVMLPGLLSGKAQGPLSGKAQGLLEAVGLRER